MYAIVIHDDSRLVLCLTAQTRTLAVPTFVSRLTIRAADVCERSHSLHDPLLQEDFCSNCKHFDGNSTLWRRRFDKEHPYSALKDAIVEDYVSQKAQLDTCGLRDV